MNLSKIFAARISHFRLIFPRRWFFHEKIWLRTNHERMLASAIKLIFHESVSGALDTVWIGLFRVGPENREGSCPAPAVDAFLHWTRANWPLFCRGQCRELTFVQYFPSTGCTRSSRYKVCLIGKHRRPDACGLASATGAHTHIYTYRQKHCASREKYSSFKNVFAILLTKWNASFNSIKNFFTQFSYASAFFLLRSCTANLFENLSSILYHFSRVTYSINWYRLLSCIFCRLRVDVFNNEKIITNRMVKTERQSTVKFS